MNLQGFSRAWNFLPKILRWGHTIPSKAKQKHHNRNTPLQQANLSSDHKFVKTQLSSEGIYVGLTLKNLSAAIIESSPCKPQER